MQSDKFEFNDQTSLALGLKELFSQLQQRLEIKERICAYIAGGMAIHIYTAARVTSDVDAEFSARISLPRDLMVEVETPEGDKEFLHFDACFNSTFALMHEDYVRDCVKVDLDVPYFDVFVLSPVDLAVSKIARFAPNDQEDIKALVERGFVSSDDIEKRASEAVESFVGNVSFLLANIRDAVAMAKDVEENRPGRKLLFR